MRAIGLLFLLVPFVASAQPAADALLQAVSFAITGSDATKVEPVDRANCIFKIRNDTYFLNNVHTERVQIRSWKNKLNSEWITVELRGNPKVVERFGPPMTSTGSKDLDRVLLEQNPDALAGKGKATRTAMADTTIRVSTNELDRVTRAWDYIYSNGCKGAKSPF